MDAQELVQRLVRGSANINRMREEINRVVDMVLGLAYGDSTDYFKPISLCDSSFLWMVVSINSLATSSWQPEARCYYLSKVVVYIHTLGSNTTALHMGDVMRVHRALPLLVSGMAKTIPGLAEKWQPLLDAADEI